jgi:sigma-54 dependent transcriptional regulator, acetoin dehydrogenase operon transcriptional activator AcoR
MAPVTDPSPVTMNPLHTQEEDAGPDPIAPERGRCAVLQLLLEAERPCQPGSVVRLDDLDAVRIGRGASRELEATAREARVRVPDRWMSQDHAILRRDDDGWTIEDQRSRNGTMVNAEARRSWRLSDGDLLEVGHTFFLYRIGARPLCAAAGTAATPGVAETFEPSFARQLDAMAKVARTSAAVLILGESGSGKEVLARAIHTLSGRRGPLVAVNCGALSSSLIEAELFGARRGAFSGALRDRVGLVRSADGGTLFLDEVADLPLGCQPALLRVLQEREVLPVGATRPQPVDMRVVAATHRDVDAMSAAGQLRHDLLARLSGMRVRVPPLRRRRGDLGGLIGSLLEKIPEGAGARATFRAEAARALLRYDWPLNVRELEQCLTSAVALASGEPIALHHLPESVVASAAPGDPPRASSVVLASSEPPRPPPVRPRTLTPRDLRVRAELIAQLDAHGGNVAAVARAMGKGRQQIHRWVSRFGLVLDSYRR